MKNNLIFGFFVVLLMIACSKKDDTDGAIMSEESKLNKNNDVVNTINNDTNSETFYIIPFGSTIEFAKNIFDKNNISIVSEESRLNKNNDVVNAIKIQGVYHDENCEVEFIFINGIFYNGTYNFAGYTKESLVQVRDKITEELVKDYGKASGNRELLIFGVIEFDFDNGISCILFFDEGMGIFTVNCYGGGYIQKRNEKESLADK